MAEILKANVGCLFLHVIDLLTCRIVDYNSWVESDTGRKLADSLDKDVVLAEGTTMSLSERRVILMSIRVQRVQHEAKISCLIRRLAE